jgi:hypothetical protein
MIPCLRFANAVQSHVLVMLNHSCHKLYPRGCVDRHAHHTGYASPTALLKVLAASCCSAASCATRHAAFPAAHHCRRRRCCCCCCHFCSCCWRCQQFGCSQAVDHLVPAGHKTGMSAALIYCSVVWEPAAACKARGTCASPKACCLCEIISCNNPHSAS